MQMNEPEQLKVGDLAEATGLTVRTLHHYDEIGLLVPSERTSSGYRLYSPANVRRLYRIVALRGLGMPLDEIAATLDREGADPREAVRLHLGEIDAELTARKQLRDRLARILDGLDRLDEPSSSDYIDAIERMTMIEKHYSPEALEKLEKKRHELGEDAIKAVEDEWAQIIPAMKAAMEAGTDPGDPEVQRLAVRSYELWTMFTGDDPEIRAGLQSMYDNEGPEAASGGMIDTALMEYMGRAQEIAGCGPDR